MPISNDHLDEKLLAEIRQLHGTKSAQIRALAEAGWVTARIAKELSIRYQHAYNVLDDAKRHVSMGEKAMQTAGISQFDLPETAPKMSQVSTAAKESDYQHLLDALSKAPQTGKKPVNLSINSSLLAAAKLLNVNLSETLERGLTTLLSQMARERWQAENSEAIEAHNRFVERHGLWSDGLRQF